MLLIVDDDLAVRTSLGLLLKQAGYATQAVATPEAALAVVRATPPALVLMDMNYSLETSGQDGLHLLAQVKALAPQVPVILITGWGSITLAVEGMKAGAAEFVTKPWNNAALLQTIGTILSLHEHPAAPPNAALLTRRDLDRKFRFPNIIGQDARLVQLLRNVGQVAATDASVLIEGESGTGKELIAEAIHQNSHRRQQPFVKVNLGGISASLFESEMFGHRRGAFTDAKTDRQGRFELANKGTIFLDEIGELDMGSQVKLLRVLQDRTYEVLGDSRPRSLDIRVICATNRNLAELVQEGRFREDLFYRINLITVRLPALRERPDDIPLLVQHFVNNLRTTYHRPALKVGTRALHWLRELPLPGNIRELKNLVERAVLVSGNDELGPEDFQAQFQPAPARPAPPGELPAVGSMTLDELEAQMIRKSMEHYAGNVSSVAKALGLSRGALYRRLEKYAIPW
ncbi:DNA-binding transcriptional response regulator, NtrC family, contains REC, AAA-type ATPase, and a Fis-type DNA-binding domains [Hymenobacter daecheongensis DSM 21074]|uniref:DNA-binding transcriptional response regulator, NtrC family, contains REC, AAA-type ATPase, and a Fis-type DNA-binding domains n=1 Tax=Hymenobacter daecheongensis DSM 21074 TaxID=1121955 RepID=A0A1M6L7M1_9BACT|nr:sigma-54 dependent transcriptional regulator [Hymenobacter daecheongensis]SHJ67170.1 DNA-binding transcriptional response regulator, NtrC family, contains REC, AAA-type ATPase, and a Fis-type DNA-binding domains [Hymenobacter daecheongensis DSM 21074]